MAQPQYPIDGAPGKDWKVTSHMGWRIHPVKKTRKHHNGTDIIGIGKGPFYIESAFDGTVTHAGPSKVKTSDGEPGGFGYYVKVTSKIDGKFYSMLYAHLVKGSIKVKKGQKIEAGTVLGKMGTSGMSTGVHLHWECWVGKSHGWTDNGKGFLEPIEFTKAQIKKARVLATKDETTPDDVTADVVEDAAPEAPQAAPEAPKKAEPAAKAPAAKPAPKAATAAPAAKIPGYTVKSGDSYWKIAEKFAGKHGGGRGVSEYTKHLQALNKNKALKPGDKVRLA